MTTRGPVSASDASIADVLRYLDGEFLAFSRGVADGRYTFWLGSGISLSRVEGLKQILFRALIKLHSLIDPGDDHCRFKRALQQVLSRSGLTADKLATLDKNVDPTSWPKGVLNELLNGLAQNYSKVLDVRISGEASDYLLWEIIDVRASYADPGIDPDCEHLAIAVLALEGHAPQILSANWDGLIESAFATLGHSSTGDLRVCVLASDLEGTTPRTRLIKFHGCAIRASGDEATHRPLLIHQAHQIVNYHNNRHYRAVRNELVSQATTRPTFMVGLSAQDVDIQQIFSDAAAARTWHFPSTPPAYIFAENELGADQGTILRFVYGATFDSEADKIEGASVLRAYAKALLTGLLLHVLCQKLQGFVMRSVAPKLNPMDLDALCSDIEALRNLVANQRHLEPLDLVIAISQSVSFAMHLFRTGRAAEPGVSPYWPLTSSALHAIEADTEVPVGGLPELAVGLGLLARGLADCDWVAELRGPESSLVLTATATGSESRIFFVGSARSAVTLEQTGLVDSSSGDAVIIHSDRVTASASRSPRVAPGRTGKSGPRRVDMVDLLADVMSLDELRKRFREVAGL